MLLSHLYLKIAFPLSFHSSSMGRATFHRTSSHGQWIKISMIRYVGCTLLVWHLSLFPSSASFASMLRSILYYHRACFLHSNHLNGRSRRDDDDCCF